MFRLSEPEPGPAWCPLKLSLKPAALSNWAPDRSFKVYYSLMCPLCVLISHCLWLLQMSVSMCVCVCLRGRYRERERKPVWKSSLIKLSLCFYSKHPPPFSFHLSPPLNICLSIHGWIYIPLRRGPGGRGRWNGCKVRIQAHHFPSHCLGKDNTETSQRAHSWCCYRSPNITNIFLISLMSRSMVNAFTKQDRFFTTPCVRRLSSLIFLWSHPKHVQMLEQIMCLL